MSGRARFWWIGLALILVSGCAKSAARPNSDRVEVDLRSRKLLNRAAHIPPQCFTRVQDPPAEAGAVATRAHNPCYVCHADARTPNEAGQPELQLSYDFPQLRAGRQAENQWHNLFRDLRAATRSISDVEVQRYVAHDNYGQGSSLNAVAARLVNLPAGWDVDDSGLWDGYVPDAGFSFDAAGFDRTPDGVPTGYRVFAYYPLPGGFMPANGSFDDVLIRLPPVFRMNEQGHEDLHVYAVNLAVLEALIKRTDVAIDEADERELGVDLDRDGMFGRATHVSYAFRPGEPESMSYVGLARRARHEGKVQLAPGLFPQGTEFLHSVRYASVDETGTVRAAPRMKELRYARKSRWLSYSQLSDRAQREAKDEALNPDRVELVSGDAERGLVNRAGWIYQGFIEDARGELRPQTYEETLSCMGCHGGLSATEDSSFAFVRKLSDGPAHGFHALHWDERPPTPDPLRADGLPEYATYLRNNPEGDAYRSNDEIRAHFFDAAGGERADAFERLATDVTSLLLPSPERALALNKAYWVIVREQSFREGRDAVLAPVTRVLAEVRPGEPTGIASAEPSPRLRL